MAKLNIKKGDNVMVISGNSKGKSGRVLEVLAEKNRLIVEGVNLMSKHTKPNAKNPKGGIIKQEASLHISNAMIIDKSGKPTRVGKKLDEKTNKLVRYSKNTKEVIK